jgi:hypothetical protein
MNGSSVKTTWLLGVVVVALIGLISFIYTTDTSRQRDIDDRQDEEIARIRDEAKADRFDIQTIKTNIALLCQAFKLQCKE